MPSSEMVNTDIDQNPIDKIVPLDNHPFVNFSRLFDVFRPNFVILVNRIIKELCPICSGVSGPIVPQRCERRWGSRS